MFLFSLAKELGKTVKELSNSMDAREFMEWIAYSHLQDPEYRKQVEQIVQTDEDRANLLRAFFSKIRPSK